MHFPASDLTPEQTYRLMTGIVVPRPIAWITSLSEGDTVNVAPFSCYTIVSNKPPMIGVNIGRKAGVRKDTGRNIIERGHFVVNIADSKLLDPLHDSADEHPPEVSEVDLLGLEIQPSSMIETPRLAAVPISLECKLHTVIPFGDTGAEFFVGEVVMYHIREGLCENGKIDTKALDPICRIAGPQYASLGTIVTKRTLQQTAKVVMNKD